MVHDHKLLISTNRRSGEIPTHSLNEKSRNHEKTPNFTMLPFHDHLTDLYDFWTVEKLRCSSFTLTNRLEQENSFSL